MRQFVLLILGLLLFSCNSETNNEPRQEIDFNFNWKFFRTQEELSVKNIQQHNNWETVQVPHDWSVKNPYSQAYIVTDSTPNLGYIGWYKKEITPKDKNKIYRLDFDGVYNNSEVYLNGTKITERPFGYSAFSANLNEHLVFGKKNEIIVKVNNRAFLDGRWYNGAGIYRDVKLTITNPIHIKKWGVGISTSNVSEERATINTTIELTNKQNKELIIEFQVINKQQQTVAKSKAKLNNEELVHSFNIENPNLWDLENPNLYTLKTSVFNQNNELIDEKLEKFGMRTLKYTASDGFYLNGKKTQFKGVCLHHDAGALGVAVPDDVWKRRLKILKDGGVNAIRTAHNPPSKNFLDICDELGFLVQDEAFDEFNYAKDKRKNYKSQGKDKLTEGYVNHFQKWAERDLKDMMRRDRNHPSVVMWSIGNEIEWTYPRYGKASGYWDANASYYKDEPPLSISKMKENFKNIPPNDFELTKTATQLSKWAKEIDKTRPVTANLVIPSVSHFSGYTDALDIIGYSYRAAVYDYGHKNYPDKMILGTENWANYVEWKAVEDNEFVPGIFLWTGIFYMGETRDINERGSDSGLIDFAGFPTPRWHMFKTLWNKEPHIYATTIELKKSDYILKNNAVKEKVKDQWKYRNWGFQPFNVHWNYTKNESTIVEVFTNCPTAELFLNGKSLGVKKLADFEDHIIKWAVPFQEGSLLVKGYGEKEVTYQINTAKQPNKIKLTTDVNSLRANKKDVAHIVAQLIDENGNPVMHTNERITFSIEGGAKLLGTDNGSNTLQENFTSNECISDEGKVLLLIQSNGKNEDIIITAQSNKITSNKIVLTVK